MKALISYQRVTYLPSTPKSFIQSLRLSIFLFLFLPFSDTINLGRFTQVTKVKHNRSNASWSRFNCY